MGMTIPIYPLSMKRDTNAANPMFVGMTMTVAESIDLRQEGD